MRRAGKTAKCSTLAGTLLLGLSVVATMSPSFAASDTVRRAVPVVTALADQAYLAARRRAAARLNNGGRKASAQADAIDQKERNTLEVLLLPRLAPALSGRLPGPPRLSLETLQKGDLGFGKLDGIVVQTADAAETELVTTRTILDAWLAEHRNWWGHGPEVPATLPAALLSEAFYTQAVLSGAAASRFAVLKLRLPTGASLAVALLIAQSQDVGADTPDTLIVAVVRGDKVHIALEQPSAAPALAACRGLRDAEWARAEAVRKASGPEKSPNLTLIKRAQAFERAGDAALRACYAERVGADPTFTALQTQAQALADAMHPR